MVAIANDQGEAVSDWFHDFRAFQKSYEDGSTTVTALIGTKGACDYVISIPGEESGRFETATDGHHELDYDFTIGAFMAKAGALTFVLAEDGSERTAGHHRVFVDSDTVYGQSGAKDAEPLFQLTPEITAEV